MSLGKEYYDLDLDLNININLDLNLNLELSNRYNLILAVGNDLRQRLTSYSENRNYVTRKRNI